MTEAVLVGTGELVEITGTHPVAALFPMLDTEDLADLAASIADRGQEHPIVLDSQGRVLDGRNRLAACALIGAKPVVEFYTGDDPDGYALAVNITRRHMTKGQIAVIAVEAHSLLSKDEGQTSSMKEVGLLSGVSEARIVQAAAVWRWAPDLVEAVKSGGPPSLNEAYKTARERKEAADESDDRITKLRDLAPDLAEQVIEERLTLKEAWAAYRAREAEEERQRTVETHNLCQYVVAVSQMRGFDVGKKYDPEKALPGRAVTITTLNDAADAIQEITAIWKERGLP